MPEPAANSSWLSKRLENALKSGLSRAYETVRVHPDEYLMHLRAAHALPVSSYEGLFSLPVAELDSIARQTVRGSMKMAGAEGAGLGFGGFATIVPDLGILSAITMRMVQKLSLIYGFQYNTDEEVAELWIAAATAAGVDISKELLEKTLLKTFVQRVLAFQHRVRREDGGAHHPHTQFRRWSCAQLLFCAGLGESRRGALPPAPSGRTQPSRCPAHPAWACGQQPGALTNRYRTILHQRQEALILQHRLKFLFAIHIIDLRISVFHRGAQEV
jgi:hypothetical protein